LIETLRDRAIGVLRTADPAEKIRCGAEAAAAWRRGAIVATGDSLPPDRPERPSHPLLLPPRDMPRRRSRGLAGRIALLHAVAHIELNAVDLAWDLLARFTGPETPRGFIDDWVGVADDEGRHFGLVAGRLAALGAAYGDLPAHDGLWEAAQATSDDLLARLAIVPMVLEARGLDVTPQMIDSLKAANDPESAAVLDVIYREEIGHVAAGVRWFEHFAAARGVAAESAWQDLVRARFRGILKAPFNRDARSAAGFPARYYEPVGVIP
tara:strand:+ start:1625 stop:2425 length:801 start_codon:yes stop_codon:yes gene_type:complete